MRWKKIVVSLSDFCRRGDFCHALQHFLKAQRAPARKSKHARQEIGVKCPCLALNLMDWALSIELFQAACRFWPEQCMIKVKITTAQQQAAQSPAAYGINAVCRMCRNLRGLTPTAATMAPYSTVVPE